MNALIRAGILTGISVIALCFGTASAQGPKLTLDESIGIALRQNLAIQSAREGVSASESRKQEAFTAYLPKLSTSYNYTRQDPAPYIKQPPPSLITFLTVGTQDNYLWSLDARQPLFTGGRITANYDFSRLGVDAAKQDELGTVQDIVLDVKRSYFTVLKADRLVSVARQSMEQLTAQRDLSKNFLDVGLVPRNDYLQAEVRLADGAQQLIRAENRLEEAKARFNTVLRRPVDTPAELEDILGYEPFGLTYEECRALALEKRPEVQAYDIRAEQAGKRVKAVESEFYPTVSVAGSYQRFGDKADVSGSVYRDSENWWVGATASWDIWEWGRTKHARDASLSQERQAQNAASQVRDQVALEVKNAWLAVREAERLILVTQVSIEQAEENYRINRERYSEQVARTTDVLDALTLLTGARASYSNSLSDYLIARAVLERAMGTVAPVSSR